MAEGMGHLDISAGTINRISGNIVVQVLRALELTLKARQRFGKFLVQEIRLSEQPIGSFSRRPVFWELFESLGLGSAGFLSIGKVSHAYLSPTLLVLLEEKTFRLLLHREIDIGN